MNNGKEDFNSGIENASEVNGSELTDKKNENSLKKEIKTKDKTKCKKSFIKRFFIFISVLILIILSFLFGFIIYCAIDYTKSENHFPEGYYAVVNIPSAGRFFKKALYLNAADSVLNDSGNIKLQGALRSLRAQSFFKSWQYDILTNIRADLLFYPQDEIIFVMNLGIINSSFTRILPFVINMDAQIFDGIEGIEKDIILHNGKEHLCIIYNLKENYKLYITYHKNLIFISSSKEMLVSCFEKHKADSKKTAKPFAVNRNNSINIAADANYFILKSSSKQEFFYNLFNRVEFAEFIRLNLNIEDEELKLNGNVNWNSSLNEIEQIIKRRSTVPGILPRLPASTAYLTLINAGDPDFLFKNLQPFFTDEIKSAYKSAERGTQNMFRKSMQELIFSWMGDELGVFGHDKSYAPIFFVSLKDEKLCRKNFDYIFNSIFVGRDISAVVDGKRIPRIAFPSWLSGLLKLFKIDIPQPFYIIEDGYLYISTSAESLVLFKNEIDSGALMVKSELWKDMTKTISAETSFFIYYTLERSVPFFLQNNDLLKNIFKDYGKGILSVKLEKNKNIVLESFTKKTESHALSEIAGFPKNISSKTDAGIICAKNSSGVPCLYWINNRGVNCMELTTGNIISLPLTGKCNMAADIQKGILKNMWITTEHGSVYKTDSFFYTAPGFPIMTGEKIYSAPALTENGFAAALFSLPKLIFVKDDGDFYFSDDMISKLRSAPVYIENKIAAVPRSFESYVYLFNSEGKIIEDYPIELSGISAVQPLMFFDGKRNVMFAILTENGNFAVHSVDASKNKKFNINLNTVCKIPPVYSASLKSFFIISNDGKLFKIDEKGNLTDTMILKTGSADDYILNLLDLNGDGKDEILISGGGNSIYAFRADFSLLKGFPVAGTGVPYLIDVDGNGKKELVACGVDYKVHAFSGGGEW